MARGIPNDHTPEIKRCPTCRAKFETRHPKQEYCSPYHAWQARFRRMKPKPKRTPEQEAIARAARWLKERLQSEVRT